MLAHWVGGSRQAPQYYCINEHINVHNIHVARVRMCASMTSVALMRCENALGDICRSTSYHQRHV